jgi:type I restriction enzyme R subunit
MEYGHERAVADGVNVDYQVYRIRTAITEHGGSISKGEWMDVRNKRTRAVRWQQTDEDVPYTPPQLDREVVAPDQIRTVIRAFRDGLPTMFPGRAVVPKTLIFAKDDSHADDIVQIVREEFGKGNEFCQKITYRVTGVKTEDLIASFRNSYNPRIAVTVDMIATGTDIRPLEALLFMRLVKSKGFFDQMKGRGTRTISDDDLAGVTPDAGSKRRYILVDAVGVTETFPSDEPPLEHKRSVPFEKLLEAVALGVRDDDTLSSLAGRLGRLAKRLSPAEASDIAEAASGLTVKDLARQLVEALDPDTQIEAARRSMGQADPDDAAIQIAAQQLLLEATAPFDNPQLRRVLTEAQRRDDQLIDPGQDILRGAGWDEQARDRAREVVDNFRQYIEAHRDEITALRVLYSRPRHAAVRFEDIKQLAAAIKAPPLGLTTDELWYAYARLDQDRVRGASEKRIVTDLVALVRYALDRDRSPSAALEPYAETVRHRFASWLAEQERRRGAPFTTEQRWWLEMMRDQVTTSLAIDTDAFDYDPFIQRGGLGRATQVFGEDLPDILADLNDKVAA